MKRHYTDDGGITYRLMLSAGLALALLAAVPLSFAAGEEELLTLPPLEDGQEAERAPATAIPLRREQAKSKVEAPAAGPEPVVREEPVVVAPEENPPSIAIPTGASPEDGASAASMPYPGEQGEEGQELQPQPLTQGFSQEPSQDAASVQDAFGQDIFGQPLSAGEHSTTEVPEPQNPIAHVTWQGSLMFTPVQVENLMALYNAYRNSRSRQSEKTAQEASGVDVDALLKRIEGGRQVVDVPDETLNLTLNSIVYYNPKDWSIWLNGGRYFRDDALSGIVIGQSTLRVLSASDREVSLVWLPLPASVEKVKQRWRKKRDVEVPLTELSSFIAKDERVWLDDDSNVNIILRPNQTFVSQLVSVVEGGNVASAIAQLQERGNLDGEEMDAAAPQAVRPGADSGGNATGAFPTRPAAPAATNDTSRPAASPAASDTPASRAGNLTTLPDTE